MVLRVCIVRVNFVNYVECGVKILYNINARISISE